MAREEKTTDSSVKRVHSASVYFKPAEILCLKFYSLEYLLPKIVFSTEKKQHKNVMSYSRKIFH